MKSHFILASFQFHLLYFLGDVIPLVLIMHVVMKTIFLGRLVI